MRYLHGGHNDFYFCVVCSYTAQIQNKRREVKINLPHIFASEQSPIGQKSFFKVSSDAWSSNKRKKIKILFIGGEKLSANYVHTYYVSGKWAYQTTDVC